MVKLREFKSKSTPQSGENLVGWGYVFYLINKKSFLRYFKKSTYGGRDALMWSNIRAALPSRIRGQKSGC